MKDCTEGPDSCYAYVEDDCVYTGERVGEVVGDKISCSVAYKQSEMQKVADPADISVLFFSWF